MSYLSIDNSISIHALLAESDTGNVTGIHTHWISIHALLAESDVLTAGPLCPPKNFYPRSPCGERRFDSGTFVPAEKFLSTLSLRRATGVLFLIDEIQLISIHALLAESDNRYGRPIDVQLVFLSTLSLRRATITIITICTVLRFLSTLSLRRATQCSCCCAPFSVISIHALLAESDRQKPTEAATWDISIHALLAESDMGGWRSSGIGSIFLSTLSLRRAT